MMSTEFDQLIDLMTNANDIGYIGEAISQLQHGLQAAHFAKIAAKDNELIIACLLHDIGHLCVENVPTMGEFGVANHENIGANYLLDLGFPLRVAELVRGHIAAKRYLISQKKNYLNSLSPASLATLNYQGGPMNQEEIELFKRDPLFKDKLFLRTCDEKAKEPDLNVAPLDFYIPIMSQLITN